MYGFQHPVTRLPVRVTAIVILGIFAGLGRCAWAAELAADQVWLVSTRHAPLAPPADRCMLLEYWQLQADGTWTAADEGLFLASQTPAEPVSVFIHGNRADWQGSVDAGWLAYCQLKQQAGARGVRLVIWSWPAERVHNRNRPDTQEKAQRSDGQGVYLAQWLERLPPDVPVCLIGYSFGARIITGALHLLAGGDLDGHCLAPLSVARQAPIRAVLVAGAMDNDWLLPCSRNGLASRPLERLLITVNGCDPALKWYSFLYGRGGPPALGYTGLACPEWLGPEALKIEQVDVSGEVGKVHDWACYASTPSLVSRLAWFTGLLSDEP